jgi:hypothetical protein
MGRRCIIKFFFVLAIARFGGWELSSAMVYPIVVISSLGLDYP